MSSVAVGVHHIELLALVRDWGRPHSTMWKVPDTGPCVMARAHLHADGALNDVHITP